MDGPLDGLLVVALEHAVAAPACTMRLADAGARVIKIERLDGDTARHYDQAVHGVSAYFAWLNRGKESVILDLRNHDDLAIAQRMIAAADVFIQNLAPGASARLGLEAAALTARHPRLIVVDIVGYARSTPNGARRAYDMLVQAESGICAVTGTPGTPVKVGVSIADIGTGLNAHAAVMEALFEREQTGCGQAIEIAMFDSMAEWMTVPLLHCDYANQITPRTGLSHASIFPYHVTRCRDGDVVVVVQSPAEWRRFCAGILQRPDLTYDPRFVDNPSRVHNRVALTAEIQAVFGAASRAEMIARLEAHHLAWANVSTVDEVSAHPALRRTPIALDNGDIYHAPVSPLRALTGVARVPALGEHSVAVRAEFGV